MSSATVQAAIRTAFAEVWNVEIARIREPNSSFDPAGAPWVEIRFPGSDIARADIGDPDHPMWDEAGAFMCHVFVPTGIGVDIANAIADAMWEVFAGKTVSYIRFDDRLGGQAGEREDPGIEGVWWGASFGVSYRYLSVG